MLLRRGSDLLTIFYGQEVGHLGWRFRLLMERADIHMSVLVHLDSVMVQMTHVVRPGKDSFLEN